MPLHLYNTLTRRTEPFSPRDPSHVTFYSCGPTVYDDAHIGNFRSFLAADLLRRWIESPLCTLANPGGTGSGTGVPPVHVGPRRVTHVMNITDVGHMTDDAEGGEQGEDRMAVAGRRILEAKKSGALPADAQVDPTDPYQIARFYEGRFKDDARKLGLKLVLDADADPSLTPRATDNIDGMKVVIERLLTKGFAYTAGQPGARVVYFDVQKFTPYGKLSGNTLGNLKEGKGGRISGENQSQKRHAADFLLWKEDPSLRPSRSASPTLAKSSAISATSAASMAASLPATPIATPQVAAASAGASLTPSPTISTCPYCRSSSRTASTFSCGFRPARTSAMPSIFATASAARLLSPLSMTTRMPWACNPATASRAPSRTWSRKAIKPSSPSRLPTSTTVFPWLSNLSSVS